MRRWVEKRMLEGENRVLVTVNFQPDTPDESEQLDKLLGFKDDVSSSPISGEDKRSVEDGAPQTAELIGTRSWRAIRTEVKFKFV